MQIISGTVDFELQEPTAVVLGKFDGVHVGHRLLLKELLKYREKGLKTVVFTFDKSPASLFIQDGAAYRELCTAEEKREIFAQLGVDILLEFPMNWETAGIAPNEFITEMLQKRTKCQVLIAGEDITFGYKGMGDYRLLQEYSRAGAFQTIFLDKLRIKDIFPKEEREDEISSTAIRKAVGEGDIGRANTLLQRPFSIKGEVVHGNHLGGTVFQMPTANVRWPDNKVYPAFGVYAARVYTEQGCFDAITNVGKKPTIESDLPEVLAESYLYDFDGDLYGQEIRVEFYDFRRPERKFENMEALKTQMQADMEQGRLSEAQMQPELE